MGDLFLGELFLDKPAATPDEVGRALDFCAEQVMRSLPRFAGRCQNHSSVNNFYPACDNVQWTCGFWPGEIWLAYERTGNNAFREAGLALVDSFLSRIEDKIEVDHHDMGFLYSPSCVSAWKLTGSEKARRAALLAADQLMRRFQPIGGFFQAWGQLGAPDNYRYIIDCLLNLPLLFWAANETGEPGEGRYRARAREHIATCLAHSFRADGSTFHTVFMDSQTGGMLRGATCQGYRDDSAWARGQAWAICGAAFLFRHTRDPALVAAFENALAFYLSRLPEDLTPYWDMIFTSGTEEPRDSSSAAITACGLLEMARFAATPEASVSYARLASCMVKSLIDRYAVRDPAVSDGLLLHGTYSKKSPYNTCTPEGVDECTSWGDYFYMEALTRLSADWDSYW
ncbi:MAG: glycoside hydrolase family 88 protein [Oscillospiraceae bacterium]|nr:glycoside hydrolase family 88 protein [Oscillospiraceae bacterium]